MITKEHDLCLLHYGQLTTPIDRVILEAPVWPNDLRSFVGDGERCVHIALPRQRVRWNGLFTAVRLLAERTAHVGVHVQPERAGFSLDPAVLLHSRTRRHREILTAVLADAAAARVELTPEQVRVESYSATRSSLRLPPSAGRAQAWGVMSVAWLPLA
ncbi:hypothetical protein [Microbacterium sp. YJN-G]|uniref:hypothetical protein n=1 Tax=Microbacterium sp. YJN-G TaxID=2763257 RepID=UPI0018777296|nr:hypothetical protein [Microbacterium sp. YJN-G]